jgi:hypothetical protein
MMLLAKALQLLAGGRYGSNSKPRSKENYPLGKLPPFESQSDLALNDYNCAQPVPDVVLCCFLVTYCSEGN